MTAIPITSIRASAGARPAAPLANQASSAQAERRLRLTQDIADVLFGATHAAQPFAPRLRTLCETVIELVAERDQHVSCTCTVSGAVPAAQADRVLRIAHEFLAHAIKHGLHMRLLGRIKVAVTAGPLGLRLAVADDGWTCGRAAAFGRGMHLARALAAAAGGRVDIEHLPEQTVAVLTLPAGAA